MSRKVRYLVLLFSFLTSLSSWIFVAAYSGVMLHNAIHLGWALPLATRLVVEIRYHVFILPAILTLIGYGLVNRDVRDELFITLAGLMLMFAAAWPLYCLWAWSLPAMLLNNQG